MLFKKHKSGDLEPLNLSQGVEVSRLQMSIVIIVYVLLGQNNGEKLIM